MSQICFLIDELICDRATTTRQRAELMRIRRRFAVLMTVADRLPTNRREQPGI